MNYKSLILFFLIFLVSCEQNTRKITYQKTFDKYSNRGFTLVYSDELFKNKEVNKKIDERSLEILSNKLNKDTPVKITNLLNGKYVLAKVGKKSKFPSFYNSVISERIASEIEIDIMQPYIEIITVSSNGVFVAGKVKMFKEEEQVADKAPVENISIQNIGASTTSKKEDKSHKNITHKFNYIIKLADLFFEDSADLLKKRLIDEHNIKEIKINKVSKNLYRVYKGPYTNLESLKKDFIELEQLNFDNIEIIKT